MPCPICENENVKSRVIRSAVPRELGIVQNRTHAADATRYACERCGTFAVTPDDAADYLENKTQRAKLLPWLLSALLRERTLRRMPPHWLQFGTAAYGPLESSEFSPIHVRELLELCPRSVPERLNRMLCNLARLSPTGGHHIDMGVEDLSFAFAETVGEAQYHARCLVDRGYVDDSLSHQQARRLMLTADGWERFEELTQGQSASENSVFVAMWYGATEKKSERDLTQAEMKQVYDEGIEPAVKRAGYRATRVDLEHFNDFIMDQVFGDIRLAPFVIADFTGNRNGVYLEAGFARGLGIPVIHTCKADHLDDAHFDVKQLHHVKWTSAADLQEKLFHRIRNTVGLGSFQPVTDERSASRDA